MYIQHILHKIIGLKHAIIGFTDHKGLCDALRSTKLIDDRRLHIDVATLKEVLKHGKVQEICLCPTTEQLADCLTK
jgi:hypothetical protein